MGKYIGSQCIVCHNAFRDEDDIVVCPDCGTPYHRSCYEANGRCINDRLHASGTGWLEEQQNIQQRFGGTPCPSCQYVNAPEAETCTACGRTLRESGDADQSRVRIPLPGGRTMYFNASDPCCGMSPEDKMEEERVGDVASFVRTNTLYYIPLFKRFRDSRRKLSMNLSCALFPHLYFAYRKMWGMAVLSIVISLLCGLPYMLLGMLTTLTTKDFMDSLTSAYGADAAAMFDGLTAFLQAHEGLLESLNVPLYLAGLGIRVLFFLFGNYLYYRFVLKKVGRIRKMSPNDSIRDRLLNAEGGTNALNIIGGLILYYAMMFVVYLVLVMIFM